MVQHKQDKGGWGEVQNGVDGLANPQETKIGHFLQKVLRPMQDTQMAAQIPQHV